MNRGPVHHGGCGGDGGGSEDERMNIHEFQAKELLRRYGVAVLEGGVARSANAARSRSCRAQDWSAVETRQ